MKSVDAVALIAGILAATALGASAASNTVTREVAGHRFKIPKDQLFDETIARLPRPQSDSFVFLLHPNKDPDRIPAHRFLVEPLSPHCGAFRGPQREPEEQMLRIACGLEKTTVTEGPPYEKRPSQLGSWASDLYSVRRLPGSSTERTRLIADCQRFDPNPVEPKATILCTTNWGYKGMMLQFDFDETELPNLVVMKQAAMRLLDSWEVK